MVGFQPLNHNYSTHVKHVSPTTTHGKAALGRAAIRGDRRLLAGVGLLVLRELRGELRAREGAQLPLFRADLLEPRARRCPLGVFFLGGRWLPFGSGPRNIQRFPGRIGVLFG